MKIVVCNVKYSENLGDGLLAMCLEAGILRADPNIEVETIDLAGRTKFGGRSGNRKQLLKILRLFPPFLRKHLVSWKLKRQLAGYVDDWDRKIAAADAVIIGGGNLFQDDDLNFPIKISTLLESIRRYDRPLAVYAVGVTSRWSTKARALFGSLEASTLVHCSVRDRLARKAFASHFPKLAEPKVVRDPALCATFVLQNKPGKKELGNRIGICVTDPVILARHASVKVNRIPVLADHEIRTLIETLVSSGYRVSLFCNGATEDMAEIDRLCSQPYLADLKNNNCVDICPRPEDPSSLLETIRDFDAVVAHRLHACIAAYALGIPPVGLDWDSKVQGFFLATDRARFFADEGSTATHVAELVSSAIGEGVEPVAHEQNLQGAYSEIEDLVRDIRANSHGLQKATYLVTETS